MNVLDFPTPRPELYASVNSDNEGLLSVNVTSDTTNLPIDGAQVQITYNGEPDRILEETTTNSLG